MRTLAIAALAASFAFSASAQQDLPLPVSSFTHERAGGMHVFRASVRNDGSAPVRLSGRLVVLNVYAVDPPALLPIEPVVIEPGLERVVALRWAEAPVFGQVRALLVLEADGRPVRVESYSLWIAPWKALLYALGIALGAAAAVLAAVHAPVWARKWKARIPSGMTAYYVEPGDSVVTVATRYGVSWQDVVRANKLKPPYQVRAGARLLVPKHALKRPEPAER
jgi:hypothetical protein